MNRDKSEAEAEDAVAIAGAVAAPVRRTAVPREAEPTAATEHADRAGRRPYRICSISTVTCVPITAPLPYIPVHIVQPPVIGTFLTDGLVPTGRTTIIIIPANLIQITA